MSPTWYVFVLGPLSESALGRSPYFSRPNRSFIDTFNGRTETKSRAVVLSANVAVRSFPPTFILIFMFCVSHDKKHAAGLGCDVARAWIWAAIKPIANTVAIKRKRLARPHCGYPLLRSI